MTAKKRDAISWVSPWGTARFPKISSPDTNGKFADNKFKTDLAFEDDEMDVIEAQLRDMAKKLFPDVDPDEVRLPIREFKTREGEPEGRGLHFKSQYRPAVFDAKKKKLPEGMKLGAGSELRIASAAYPWSKAEERVVVENGKTRREKGMAYGIGLRLGDVQVRKLVESAGSGDGSAFSEVEGGFTYDGTDAFGDDNSGDSATDF